MTISKLTAGLATATLMASIAVASTPAAAEAAGFGASWQMNDTTGVAVDSTGNGNSGALHGGIVRTGSAYDFDGRTGYVSVANSASLNPGSASMTITVKFSLDGNPAPSGYDYDLVRKGLAGTTGGDYKVEILSSGKALCRFRGNTAVQLRGGTNLGTGTHTVQCAKTSTSVSLRVDGAVKASQNLTVGSISNTQPVILGAKPGDDFTNGRIDFITIA